MKIAILTPCLKEGDAIGHDVLGMYHSLIKVGHSAVLCSGTTDLINHHVHIIDPNSPSLPEGTELLIYHLSMGYDPGLRLLKTGKYKKIIKYHNITPEKFFDGICQDHYYHTMIGRQQLKEIISLKCDLYISDSAFNSKDLGSDLVVLPPFHRIENLRQIAPDQNIMSRYSDGITNILVVGKLMPNKNHLGAIAAFEAYRRNYNQKSRLLIVGNIDERLKIYIDKVRTAAASSQNVVITGFVTPAELAAYYRTAHCLLVASMHEGFCVPAIEAMAMGIPIVGYSDSALKEVVGLSGVLSHLQDEEHLAEAICFSQQDWVKSHLPQHAYKKYEQSYCNDVIEQKFIGIIDKPIVIKGHFGHITGYTTVANEITKAFLANGYKPNIIAYDATNKLDRLPASFLPYFVDKMETAKIQEFDKQPNIITSPPFACHMFEPNKHSIIVTMWETDTIKKEHAETLNKAGLIIVPNSWNRDNFYRCGVSTPIEVLPLGYDDTVFYLRNEFPKTCTFGMAAQLWAGGFRKNAELLVRSFRAAFPTETDVKLKIKLSPICQLETYNDNRIEVIKGYIELEELAKWHESLTAFVNTSAAEGFGLHLMEAMASGRPLISTRFSGPMEYFDSSVGYELAYTIVPVSANEYYEGNWSRPSMGSIVSQMRNVYANQEQARQLGLNAASHAKKFTWSEFGRKLVQLFQKFNV